MKICFIAPLFEPWNIGGDTTYIDNLVHNLSKNNDVILITIPGPEKRIQNKKNQNFKIIELKLSNIAPLYSVQKNLPKMGLAKRTIWHMLDLWNYSYYNQIKKILENEKPDVVHTNSIKGISSSVFSAVKSKQIPHVHNVLDYELISLWVTLLRGGKPIQFNWIDNIYTSWMRYNSSNISAVISGSKFTLDLFLKMGFFKNSKKFVIPHGIILKTGVKPKEGIGRDFFYLGRLNVSKGVHVAIQAFKQIKEENARLHIVGDGSEEGALKKLAKGDNRIIFHGALYENDLVQLFNKCSFGIVPSIWHETFGYVIIMFMNNGIPIIGSNMGAIPELIRDGDCGFIYNAHDVESLQKIMEKVLVDEKILNKLSQNAILASKKFSIDDEIKATIKVYNSVRKR